MNPSGILRNSICPVSTITTASIDEGSLPQSTLAEVVYDGHDSYIHDNSITEQQQQIKSEFRHHRRQIRSRSSSNGGRFDNSSDNQVEPAKKRLRRLETSSLSTGDLPSTAGQPSLPFSYTHLSSDSSPQSLCAPPTCSQALLLRENGDSDICGSPLNNYQSMGGTSDDGSNIPPLLTSSCGNPINDLPIPAEHSSSQSFNAPPSISHKSGQDIRTIQDDNQSTNKNKKQRICMAPLDINRLCRIQPGWDPNRATACRQAQAHGSIDTEDSQSSGTTGDKMQLYDFVKIMQIGQGAYGDVWLAQDLKRDRLVALKKLRLNEEREGFPKNSIREISLLRYLRHPNIVGFYGIVYSRPKLESLKPLLPVTAASPYRTRYEYAASLHANLRPIADSASSVSDKEANPLDIVQSTSKSSTNHFEGGVFPVERGRSSGGQSAVGGSPCKSSVWMVFEYLPFDLNGIIEQLREQDKQLSVAEVKLILRDILLALEFCHSHNVMHRDLKSANLLISSSGRIKLADFGLARYFNASSVPLTNRVITLWYRPPELLLGAEWYTPSVDIWSAGCIFAELVINKAIFGADNEPKVLKSIAECLGPPSASEWPERTCLPYWNSTEFNPLLAMPAWEPSVTSPSSSNSLATVMSPNSSGSSLTSRIGAKGESLWTKLNDRIGQIGLSLLKSMLRYNPKDRITAKDALSHVWFTVDGVIDGLPLGRFQRGHCHAYALRKDRDRLRDLQRLQQQSSTSQTNTAAQSRKQGPRVVCNTEYLEKTRRALQNRTTGNVSQSHTTLLQDPIAQQRITTLSSEFRVEHSSITDGALNPPLHPGNRLQQTQSTSSTGRDNFYRPALDQGKNFSSSIPKSEQLSGNSQHQPRASRFDDPLKRLVGSDRVIFPPSLSSGSSRGIVQSQGSYIQPLRFPHSEQQQSMEQLPRLQHKYSRTGNIPQPPPSSVPFLEPQELPSSDSLIRSHHVKPVGSPRIKTPIISVLPPHSHHIHAIKPDSLHRHTSEDSGVPHPPSHADNDSMDIEMMEPGDPHPPPPLASIPQQPGGKSSTVYPDAPCTPPPPEPAVPHPSTSPRPKTPPFSPRQPAPLINRRQQSSNDKVSFQNRRPTDVSHRRVVTKELKDESPGHKSEGEVTDAGSTRHSPNWRKREELKRKSEIVNVGNRPAEVEPHAPPVPSSASHPDRRHDRRSPVQRGTSKGYAQHSVHQQSRQQSSTRHVYIESRPSSSSSSSYQQYYLQQDHDYYDRDHDHGGSSGSRSRQHFYENHHGSYAQSSHHHHTNREQNGDYRYSSGHRQRDYQQRGSTGSGYRQSCSSHSSGQQRYNNDDYQSNRRSKRY